MAQYNMPTLVPTTDTGTTLCNYLTGGGNGWVAAVNSSHSGTTAPTYNIAGMPFYNTTDKSWGVWNGTNYDMRFSGSGYFAGKVGIGATPTTREQLLVKSNGTTPQTITADISGVASATFGFRSSGNRTDAAALASQTLFVGTGLGGAINFSVKGDGSIWAAALSTTAGNAITSDTRMKKDWRDGIHDLNDLDAIETGHFKFIHHDDDLEHYGFKAQSLPVECQHLTDQIVPEHEDLYYDDVEVTEEVALEEGDDGYVVAQTGDDFDNEEPVATQTKTVSRMERQRNDVPLDDAHRVLAVNVGAVLAKTVEHNKMLKAELEATKASFEARLAALESK